MIKSEREINIHQKRTDQAVIDDDPRGVYFISIVADGMVPGRQGLVRAG